ncbi:valacyclovir hydrolase-like protein [Dinothrombium tinctorium]|uniref:Valacyclovir hydrolase-like protein n=1 Tax=Dinothrombium tinctorium TaxID=1965070 RepID=A0A3S3PBA2_9ACAR|nr:valacyclovir hydrolase-like protein [Dinothrombium tinctorium]
MSAHKIDVNGISIHYEKVGRGPNVVLLLPGGLGSTRTDFDEQLKEFDRLDFTTIAWDPPGFGYSRPPERSYTKDVFVEDAKLAHQMMKNLGYERYSVVGWSDGGKTALIMAFLFPENVQKLVVFGVIMYGTRQTWLILNQTKSVAVWSGKRRKAFEKVYGDQLESLWSHHVESMQTCGAISNVNQHEKEIMTIKCPVFALHGDVDPIVKYDQVEYLKKLVPHARIHRFPKGSHDMHIAFADEFNEMVQEFLLP